MREPTATSIDGAKPIQLPRPTPTPSACPRGTGDGTIGKHRQPHLPFGRPDGSEHAELRQPPLCNDGKARRCDEGDEEQHERRGDEHQDCGNEAPPRRRRGRERAVRVAERTVRIDSLGVGVHEHRDRIRSGEEVVRERARTDRRDRSGSPRSRPPSIAAVELERVSDVDPDRRHHPRRRRHLLRRRRVAAGPEPQHRPAECAVGVLRAHVDRGRRARHGDVAMTNCIDAAEPVAAHASILAGSVVGSGSSNKNALLAVPNSACAEAGASLSAAHMPATAIATVTVSSDRISRCRRHSRRNSRPAHRTMARRAGTPPSCRSPFMTPMPERAATRARWAPTTGRRRDRHAGRRRGPPTTRAARRG